MEIVLHPINEDGADRNADLFFTKLANVQGTKMALEMVEEEKATPVEKTDFDGARNGGDVGAN